MLSVTTYGQPNDSLKGSKWLTMVTKLPNHWWASSWPTTKATVCLAADDDCAGSTSNVTSRYVTRPQFSIAPTCITSTSTQPGHPSVCVTAVSTSISDALAPHSCSYSTSWCWTRVQEMDLHCSINFRARKGLFFLQNLIKLHCQRSKISRCLGTNNKCHNTRLISSVEW